MEDEKQKLDTEKSKFSKLQEKVVALEERIKELEQEKSLHTVLRSLIQNTENYVSFIFCGSDVLLISCLEERNESQLFQSLHPIEVGQMLQGDIQDIFKLQSRRYDIQFTKEAVDTIWQYTQGLVWYAKLIAYLVIDNIFRKLSLPFLPLCNYIPKMKLRIIFSLLSL